MATNYATGTRRYRPLSGARFENLESRIALSATPPTVVDVSVAGADWSPAFTQYLEDNGLGASNELVNGHEVLSAGYSIPVGSADQADPLPWAGIDQIRIRFSEDVQVDAADLSLSGINQAYAFSDFDYYPEIDLAVWTLEDPIEADKLWIDLDADGIDPVTDLDGNVLDGEWTNSSSTFASGDGVAGGDFEFSFNVLPGDALGIGILEYNNLFTIYYREGLDVEDASYLPAADVDGDGLIESSDWWTVWDNLYATIPAGSPIGASNDAPTSISLGLTEITDDTVDVAFSLHDVFDDAETPDSQLTYAVTSNSDSSLFDSVTIDQQTGELIVNAAAGVSGRAEIVVTATDQAGLTVESIALLDVDRQNVLPSLNVTTTDAGLGFWLIEGWVSDPDDDLDDMFVLLTGLVDELVSVAETGYFYYVVLLDPGEGGSMWADVADKEGHASTVYFEIGW